MSKLSRGADDVDAKSTKNNESEKNANDAKNQW